MQINELRSRINAINDEMLSLFLQRMELSKQIAEIKRENNLPVFDRAREREVLESMTEKAGDMQEYVSAFFQKVMEISRDYQNGLRE